MAASVDRISPSGEYHETVAVHLDPREALAVEEGNSRTGVIVPGWIENAMHSGGPDAHRWRATSGGRWSGSRRTNGCPPRRRRPIPPCFLSESLNERAKWIARGIEDAIPTQRVVETTPARASEVQRGDAVKMAAKKTPAVRCVIGSVLP